jgi:hypothetical protein
MEMRLRLGGGLGIGLAGIKRCTPGLSGLLNGTVSGWDGWDDDISLLDWDAVDDLLRDGWLAPD